MTKSTNSNAAETKPAGFLGGRRLEWAGICGLVLLAAGFLKISWRKWPDPIVDSGMQWYTFWRMSQGAVLYHDLAWNYGPLSAFFNAGLFKIFGPGMMVLVTANLVVWGLIVTMAYVAVRRAWGGLAAFGATAVFICVFSFSHLSQIGNYNYATPYSHEATHGILLILATVFAAAWWRRGVSLAAAFLVGLCGGLAAVLKPEFMLAGGAVGMAAMALRFAERRRVTAAEFAMLAAGLALPTVIFTAWFARLEPLGSAFIDASRAWWLVLVDHSQLGKQQGKFAGLDDAGAHVLFELKSTAKAALSLAVVWAAGWSVNRSWKPVVRGAVAVAAGVLLWFLAPVGGWYSIGRCFPILIVALAALIAARVMREWRAAAKLEEQTAMALLLVLAAGTMLARMPLFPRIYHLGFFQAALAGVVLAAAIIAELPRWTGAGAWGRCVAKAGGIATLATGCVAIGMRSAEIRSYQTQVVGEGRDRFYSFEPQTDAMGALVNWTAEQLRETPPRATALVLPEGLMINYLSRRASPLPPWDRHITEEAYLTQLQAAAPDFVVLISRNATESVESRFGTEGGPGTQIAGWVRTNYAVENQTGADPLASQREMGVVIFRKKQGGK